PAVGLEAKDAVTDLAEPPAAPVDNVGGLPAAVALAAIDPTVKPPAQVVDHPAALIPPKAVEKHFLLVGFAVPVGVAQQDNLRRLRDDDPVPVEDKTGEQREPFIKHGPLVDPSVAVGVFEDQKGISGGGFVGLGGKVR